MMDHRQSFWPLLLLLMLFAALTVPAIYQQLETTFVSVDAKTYHVPQINGFLQDGIALFDYDSTSATTPGHHVYSAIIAMLFGYNEVTQFSTPIVLATALFGFGLLLFAWLLLRHLAESSLAALLLALPLACSSYIVNAAVWPVTDNGALFFYTSAIWAMTVSGAPTLVVSLILVLMVWWRQMYLPVAAIAVLPVLAYWFHRRTLKWLWVPLPAAALVALYAWQWHGLTPPRFQDFNALKPSMAVPVQAIALLGLFSCAYAPFFYPGVRHFPRRMVMLIACAVSVVAIILWGVTESTANEEAGRNGSLVWLFAKHSPIIEGRALFVFPLIWLGLLSLVLQLLAAIQSRKIPYALFGYILYCIGYSAQALAWQRYVEPHTMLALSAFAASQVARFRLKNVLYYLPLLLMIAVFLAMGQARLHGLVGAVLLR